MIIIIDDREEALLQLMQSSQTQQQYVKRRLALGDIAISETETTIPGVLIERKTITDFLHSAHDNRLYDQLSRLQEDSSGQKWLLLEGCVDTSIELYATHAQQAESTIRALYLSLLSRTIVAYDTINVIQLSNIVDTHQFIMKRLTHCHTKSIDQNMRISWQPTRKKIQNVGYMSFLLSFPGMGLKRCHILIQKFLTLRSLLNATEDEIADVIGNKIAKSIFLSFDEQSPC